MDTAINRMSVYVSLGMVDHSVLRIMTSVDTRLHASEAAHAQMSFPTRLDARAHPVIMGQDVKLKSMNVILSLATMVGHAL